MLDKIKRKMIIIVCIIVAIVFALIVTTSILVNYKFIVKDEDETTHAIAANNGRMPRFEDLSHDNSVIKDLFGAPIINRESEFSTRYFIVYYDHFSVTHVYLDSISAVDSQYAQWLSDKVLQTNSEVGFIEDYRYRVCNYDDGQYIIFLDIKDDLRLFMQQSYITAVISSIIGILICIGYIFASEIILRPFVENSLKQRQFITDASHELKTPLAIINANAEVLEYQIGSDNEWLEGIKEQVLRTNSMVSELLTLAKSEEMGGSIELARVNVSELAVDLISQFKELFKNKSVDVSTNIIEDLEINANYDLVKNLFSVLLDNSAKYVPNNGKCNISFAKTSKYVVFSVENTDPHDDKIDVNRLFDRFYRKDDSRNSKTGGSGIGLSIAYRVCKQHKGHMSAKQHDGMIRFDASLSRNLKG